MPTWQTHKFGGTSLADADRFRRAADLVVSARQGGDHVAVVVSAMAGVTDELLRITEVAADPAGDYDGATRALEARVLALAQDLLGSAAAAVRPAIETSCGELRDLLRGVRIAGICAPSTRDLISGLGETWSARVLAAHLGDRAEPAAYLDAREVLVVDQAHGGPAVDWATSQDRADRWFAAHAEPVTVITGFIARQPDGSTTTLRRNGSDFSASIFGKLLGARSITIWTDVAGVMSADPRLVPEAKVVPTLSYDEAMELAFFGAAVLHPQTMGPAIDDAIPIHIRSAAEPDIGGTAITSVRAHGPDPVKGFSSIDDVSLLSLEGTGMVGVPGVAGRMFDALREVGVSVIMISQASSEHSVCVAIPRIQGDGAQAAVTRAFAAEIQLGQVQTVNLSGPYSILAAVGDDMVRSPGVAARFFTALARAGINVHAIAQGVTERNISAVVAAGQASRALRAVHAGFYLAEQTVSIALLGAGNVGAELLSQLETQATFVRTRFQVDLQVRAVASSQAMLLLDGSAPPPHPIRPALLHEGIPLDLPALLTHLQDIHVPHAVILDCTASEQVAAHYEGWLRRGIHVITPNKLANTSAHATYRTLRELGDRVTTRYLYEATVGAGLPVISTLRHLLATGDRIHSIEGILSGSLSYILGAFGPDMPFSRVVAHARQLGYTEPDPREDLSGMDVARKAVILAREIGLDTALADLPVRSLIPDGLEAGLEDGGDIESFLAALEQHDGAMEATRRKAADAGRVLRYVARVDVDRAAVEVGLREYEESSAFARIGGGNNIFVFTTDRYLEQPLIVQAAGAGAAVTAAGVFGDLLTLASSLGACTPDETDPQTKPAPRAISPGRPVRDHPEVIQLRGSPRGGSAPRGRWSCHHCP